MIKKKVIKKYQKPASENFISNILKIIFSINSKFYIPNSGHCDGSPPKGVDNTCKPGWTIRVYTYPLITLLFYVNRDESIFCLKNLYLCFFLNFVPNLIICNIIISSYLKLKISSVLKLKTIEVAI